MWPRGGAARRPRRFPGQRPFASPACRPLRRPWQGAAGLSSVLWTAPAARRHDARRAAGARRAVNVEARIIMLGPATNPVAARAEPPEHNVTGVDYSDRSHLRYTGAII